MHEKAFVCDVPVIGVVHVVADGVNTGAGACVAADGATVRGLALRGGVRNAVAGAAAAALEGVVETDPVTRLVGESLNTDISCQLLDLPAANQ